MTTQESPGCRTQIVFVLVILGCMGVINIVLMMFGFGVGDGHSLMEEVAAVVLCFAVALVLKPRPSASTSSSEGNDPSNPLKLESCKVCGAETSLGNNLVNIYALAMEHEHGRFHHEYGMMCSTHARELTRQLLESGKITDGDLETATKRASAFIAPGHEQEDERTLH
jgi:hypothetical protein